MNMNTVIDTQLDRVGEFFSYFERARDLQESAHLHYRNASVLATDGRDMFRSDIQEPVVLNKHDGLRAYLRDDILTELDKQEASKAELKELQVEAKAMYVGSLVMINSIAGTETIHRPLKGNGKYRGGSFVTRDEVTGRIADIDFIRDRQRSYDLTIVKQGWIRSRTYWANIIRPAISNQVPEPIQRLVTIEFLED